MRLRVVLDTSSVVSAILFRSGRLAWLRAYWREDRCTPLISTVTALELTRVLAYPKFRLTTDEQRELLADYLPHCEAVVASERCAVQCRDVKDQPFLDLAQSGKANVLVSGDEDILVLTGQTSFGIMSPQAFASRVQEK